MVILVVQCVNMLKTVTKLVDSFVWECYNGLMLSIGFCFGTINTIVIIVFVIIVITIIVQTVVILYLVFRILALSQL